VGSLPAQTDLLYTPPKRRKDALVQTTVRLAPVRAGVRFGDGTDRDTRSDALGCAGANRPAAIHLCQGPSINNLGDIAFVESIEFERGIFVGREGDFTPIITPDPSVGAPILNDAGTVAFTRSFTDETTQEFVEEIVTIEADGTLTVVADTTGAFAFFGFRPPSINNDGDVAFHATLDDGPSGVFVGANQVIGTGDTLDGSTVQNLTFCEEGLSDSGELAFVATLVGVCDVILDVTLR
jgi:hypothetical protein